jgi:hypothetical protein
MRDRSSRNRTGCQWRNSGDLWYPTPPRRPCLFAWLGLRALLTPSMTALDLFWRPLLASSGRMLICMGTEESSRQVLAPPEARSPVPNTRQVSFQRAVSLADVVAFLKSKNRAYLIQADLETTLSELRSGPAIVIGAFNNQWRSA